MTENPFDILVLGGGAGGVPAALRAAQLGGRVAVVEQHTFGGMCMNRGCIPFGNAMVASAFMGGVPLGRELGLSCPPIHGDYAALKKRQDELIEFMRQGVESTLRKNRVELFRGRGTLSGKGQVRVGGSTLNYKKLILAAGAEWITPDFPDAHLEGVVNSDYFLEARTLPARVLLYGESPWLIQIAQFLHRYGSQVLLGTPHKALLHQESKTIGARLTAVLKSEETGLATQMVIQGLQQKKSGLHCHLKIKGKEETAVVDRVVTLPRRAALKGLGLERVGLEVGDSCIAVNERMETAVKDVFAIGDIAAPAERHYSHLAAAGGVVAAENAMGAGGTLDLRGAARVLFTQPQVACVGLTKKDAKKAGYSVVTGSAPLSMNPKGMVLSQREGIVEVVAEREYGQVVGIHLLGETACEMAGLAVLALQMEVTLEELARVIIPHPTLSESVAEAARDCLGRPLYLP